MLKIKTKDRSLRQLLQLFGWRAIFNPEEKGEPS
jgi:hypothetical protein